MATHPATYPTLEALLTQDGVSCFIPNYAGTSVQNELNESLPTRTIDPRCIPFTPESL